MRRVAEAPAPAPLIQEQMKPTISNLRQRTLGECVLWAKEIKRKRATEEIEERRERPSANAVNATRRKWIVPRLVCCEDREDFEYKGELDGHNDPEDESGWEDVSGNESGSGDEDDGSEDEDGSQDDDGSDQEDGSEEEEFDWEDGASYQVQAMYEAIRLACTCAYERSGICKLHKRLLKNFYRSENEMNDEDWGGSGTFQSGCGYPELEGQQRRQKQSGFFRDLSSYSFPTSFVSKQE